MPAPKKKRKWKRKPKELPSCLWCDNPGTHLCDKIIGRDRDKAVAADPGEPMPSQSERRRRERRGREFGVDLWPNGRPPGTMLDNLAETMITCDAPICDEHRKVVGHICGRPHYHDTTDLCPYHTDWDTKEEVMILLSESEAEAYRRRLRIAAQNGLTSVRLEEFYG